MKCCGPEMMEDKMGDFNPKDMMKFCCQKCGWMPIIPITLGIIAFTIGYFLSADFVKILWLVLSGLTIFIGLVGLLMMRIGTGFCRPTK